MKPLKYSLILIYTFAAYGGFSQKEDKLDDHVIEVIGAYKPTISDAFKINELPAIKDSFKIEPRFLYAIESKQILTDFQVEPIKPAKMLDEPLAKLYNSYIRLGFGNYISPYAELFISNLRSKKFNYAAILRHQSSFGKIENEGGKKAYAGYIDNAVSISGKKFLPKKTLYGTVDYRDNTIYYYGYNALDSVMTAPPLEKKELRDKKLTQQFTLASFNGGIKTNYTDKSHLNYDIWLNYYYFQDVFSKNENYGSLNAKLSKYYNKELLGVDTKVDMIQKNFDDTLNAVVKLNPWVSRVTDQWEVCVGLCVFSDVYWDAKFYFYPDVLLQYGVYGKYIVPYIGINGYVEENTYRKIAYENLFIKPGLDIRNTNHKKVLFGGVKGSISSNTFYNVKATLSDLANTYFYVNDTTLTTLNNQVQRLQNQFTFIAADVTLFNIYGEVSVKASEKLNFHLKGNYYYFDNMKSETKAWHIPEYDAVFTTNYNLRNKIIVRADIFVIGDRFAKTFDFSPTGTVNGARNIISKKLNPVVDANLGIEYRYNKILSAFLNFNNIANQTYYRWNNYPMQGFNLMGGITYSF
ncbi:MAG: hypothetical protein HY958_14015 [Bacteroidia bacterium]|nr:hypothetical protein [Bacteroidia bacterium]